jgi:HEAT repeat protein
LITSNSFFMSSLELESALADLRSTNKEVRAHASASLSGMGKTAVPPLLTLLNDTNWVIRYRAAEALGAIGDVQVVESLIALTTDEKDHVRYMAAKSLGKMQDPRIPPILIGLLTDDHPYTRRIAAEGLARSGSDLAMTPLMQALEQEPDPDVKNAIRTALSQIMS